MLTMPRMLMAICCAPHCFWQRPASFLPRYNKTSCSGKGCSRRGLQHMLFHDLSWRATPEIQQTGAFILSAAVQAEIQEAVALATRVRTVTVPALPRWKRQGKPNHYFASRSNARYLWTDLSAAVAGAKALMKEARVLAAASCIQPPSLRRHAAGRPALWPIGPSSCPGAAAARAA